MPEKLTAKERNDLFSTLTRQNWQPMPAMTLTENGQVSFTVPKARLLSKIQLFVEGSFKAIHATETTFTPDKDAPYSLITNVKVDLNNGFTPFNVSGQGVYNLNLLTDHSAQAIPTTVGTARKQAIQTVVSASSAGASNTTRFKMDLQLTLNDRELIGLIMAQAPDVNITVTISVGSVLANIMGSASGFTTSTASFTVYPLIETYSIPPAKTGVMPDLGVIKLVQEQLFTLPASGDNIIKLPVGQAYRKIVLDVYDSSGAFADNDLNSVSLMLNQAETPYIVTAKQLMAINQDRYNGSLPAGKYVIDFSYMGLANYGGSRDLINTEQLTEFWLKLNVGKAGTVRATYETITTLV